MLAISSYSGLFRAAEVGREFASAQEVAAKFGDTSDDNYRNSGAGEAFLKFARTYWSFRLIERQIVEEDCNTIACHILRWLDTMIAPLFFPSGPTLIPVKRRRADQRRYLERYSGRDMDSEGLLSANPILNAEQLHQRSSGGGLGKFLVVCFVLGTLAFIVSKLFG